MKINKMIKERRTAKGLTQEQVATYLGVSTPAVNKWERGATYPDITLLPPLARLLGTDLNTLLSFQEDLTDQEVGHFCGEVATAATENGLDAALRLAMGKIQEFPNGGSLILNLAHTLEGASILCQDGGAAAHAKEIESLYERAAKSAEPTVSNQAKSMLISKHIARKEYEAAEALLDALPDETDYNKAFLRIRLAMERECWADAAALAERRVLAGLNSLQFYLINLAEIAWREGRAQDAGQISACAAQISRSCGLWAYSACLPDYLLSLLKQDVASGKAALKNLAAAAYTDWIPADSPLFRHMESRQAGQQTGSKIVPRILDLLEHHSGDEYDFLRASPDWEPFLAELRADCP